MKHSSLVLFIEILRGMLIYDNIFKNCIIVTDLNIDLTKRETHYNTGEFLNNMLNHGFMPTRVTNHSCTLTDHIFIYYSKTFRNYFLTENLFTDISDHFANFLPVD